MNEVIFIISMFIYGIISRIQFVMRFGSSLGIDITTININEKYLRSKLSFVAFIAYFTVLIWGIINIFWLLAVFIMFGGLFVGGLLVTDANFKHLFTIKPQLELSIILMGLYLWGKSIFLI